ncbi:MAG: hypothetical protein JWR15_4476 [Prosthecobacter sp.]|nr:hypothetical protein [Prosthecobacter sp.]
MIVIGKHYPGFQAPAEAGTHFEKAAMQHGEAFSSAEMMFLQIGADRDKIDAVCSEAMERGMGPCELGIGIGMHSVTLRNDLAGCKRDSVLECGGRDTWRKPALATPLSAAGHGVSGLGTLYTGSKAGWRFASHRTPRRCRARGCVSVPHQFPIPKVFRIARASLSAMSMVSPRTVKWPILRRERASRLP